MADHNVDQTLRAPRISEEEWESLRPVIQHLYLVEKKTQEAIRATLAKDYGLNLSKKQLKSKLGQGKWNFSKNISREEMNCHIAKKRRRADAGQEEVIERHGMAINDKIDRAEKRFQHDPRPPTVERLLGDTHVFHEPSSPTAGITEFRQTQDVSSKSPLRLFSSSPPNDHTTFSPILWSFDDTYQCSPVRNHGYVSELDQERSLVTDLERDTVPMLSPLADDDLSWMSSWPQPIQALPQDEWSLAFTPSNASSSTASMQPTALLTNRSYTKIESVIGGYVAHVGFDHLNKSDTRFNLNWSPHDETTASFLGFKKILSSFLVNDSTGQSMLSAQLPSVPGWRSFLSVNTDADLAKLGNSFQLALSILSRQLFGLGGSIATECDNLDAIERIDERATSNTGASSTHDQAALVPPIESLYNLELRRERPAQGQVSLNVVRSIAHHHGKSLRQSTDSFYAQFIPEASSMGIAVSFDVPADHPSCIRPAMNTLNVVPPNAPIVGAILADDLDAVRILFATRRASVWDVEKFGNSIIFKCAVLSRGRVWKSKTLEWLLSLGQSVKDSPIYNTRTDLGTYLWAHKRYEGNVARSRNFFIELSARLFRLSQCVDNRLADQVITGPLFEVLAQFARLQDSFYERTISWFTGLQHILESNYSLSQRRSVDGATPLLSILGPMHGTVPCIRIICFLVENGANIQDTDYLGNSALHRLIARRLYPKVETPSSVFLQGIFEAMQKHCPSINIKLEALTTFVWENLRNSYGLRGNYNDAQLSHSYLAVSCLFFLGCGCNPNIRNHKGETADDLAQGTRSETGWLWALERAGYCYNVRSSIWEKSLLPRWKAVEIGEDGQDPLHFARTFEELSEAIDPVLGTEFRPGSDA